MKNIASAFVKAQSAFGPALKTAVNGQFAKGNSTNGKYAPLDACLDAVMSALNQNGVALIQQTHHCEDGVIVETLFVHESGETMSGGRLHVPADKQNAHGYGSALTYARRYSLMASCGIAPEDDDGNAASKESPRSSESKPQKVQALRHSPLDPVGIAPHRKAVIDDSAESIKALMEKTDVVGAYEIYTGFTDVEEKTALWQLLDSGTRSAIKKHGEALKEAA